MSPVPATPDSVSKAIGRVEDDQILRQRRLQQFLLALMAGFALVAMVRLVTSGADIHTALFFIGTVVFAYAYRENQQGKTRRAAVIMLCTLLVVLCFTMLALQGLYNVALVAYPCVLVLAYRLVSARAFLVTLAILIGSVVLAFVLHVSGLHPNIPITPLGYPRFINILVTLVVNGFIILLVFQDLHRLIAQQELDKQALIESRDRITYLAYRDSLTHLPNRALAKDRLQQMLTQAQRNQGMVAVLFLDLDDFKTVNDSLGHGAGDMLLCQVSQRLESVLRPTGTVARLSGDEFLLLLAEPGNEEAIAAVATKIMQQFIPDFKMDDVDIRITASLGIAVSPRDGADIDTLLKNADLAMYQSKETGRNTFRFFNSDMNANILEHLHLAAGIRTALQQNGFRLYYQPQWDLRSGRIIGAEALIRWQHPELGWISPARFIPVAERTGLINELGLWVLHQACTDLQRWRQAGFNEIRIAVNVAPLQFRRSDMVHEVEQALHDYGLPAHALELEITESMLVVDAQHLEQTLQHLSKLGVLIAIDDFGTGYSNLAYLQRYAVHFLKIDQSFVRQLCHNVQAEGIVRAIIEMARCLGLQTIAEGVENQHTLTRLQEFGCDSAQGFYWSPAIPAEAFIALVEGQSGAEKVWNI